jgi:aminoglycoside phosphotransferase (APT) family kinase protein
VLDQAAGLLRRLHDATTGFPRDGRCWQLPAREPDEVVCHNDVAPYNLVFRDGAVAGLIDFEAAAPGPRAWDLAYLAYRLVPLTAPGNPDGIRSSRAVRAARLRRLCDAYGCGTTPEQLLPVVVTRLEELATFTEARAAAGGPAELRDHVALYRGDAALLAS